jgi:hypothetical protein
MEQNMIIHKSKQAAASRLAVAYLNGWGQTTLRDDRDASWGGDVVGFWESCLGRWLG